MTPRQVPSVIGGIVVKLTMRALRSLFVLVLVFSPSGRGTAHFNPQPHDQSRSSEAVRRRLLTGPRFFSGTYAAKYKKPILL